MTNDEIDKLAEEMPKLFKGGPAPKSLTRALAQRVVELKGHVPVRRRIMNAQPELGDLVWVWQRGELLSPDPVRALYDDNCNIAWCADGDLASQVSPGLDDEWAPCKPPEAPSA